MTAHRRTTAAVTVGILLLSACSTAEPDTVDDTSTTATAAALERDPHPVPTPVPEADTEGLWLPLTFQDLRIIDPGWDTDALYSDGIFLGVIEHGDRREFTAVDVHGEILWAAERPSGSSDFEVRTDDGIAIAVLPDNVAEDGATVSGYDLATGDLVWGPEQPPGPGSVDTTGQTQSADDGTHLDPGTGTRITLQDTTLRAEGSDGSQLWTLSVDADTQVAGVAGGLLYLREGDAIRAHNVVTGAVAQAYDPEGEGRVVVPLMMVAQGAALLMDGERPLIAIAPEAPPAP